jgi:hypothetical protein
LPQYALGQLHPVHPYNASNIDRCRSTSESCCAEIVSTINPAAFPRQVNPSKTTLVFTTTHNGADLNMTPL